MRTRVQKLMEDIQRNIAEMRESDDYTSIQDAWALLSALRGPDTCGDNYEHEKAKNDHTLDIRAAVFGNEGLCLPCDTSTARVNYPMFDSMPLSDGGNLKYTDTLGAHFTGHLKIAYEAITAVDHVETNQD